MSLLADLLSKKNSTSPSGGKDIPPTLSRAHDVTAKVPTIKNRYVLIAALSVASVTVGVLAMTQFGRLTTLLAKKTVPVVAPARPPAAVVPILPLPQAAAVPSAAPQAAEPAKPVISAPVKKTAKTKQVRHKPPARAATMPRLAAVPPIQRTIPAPAAAGSTSISKLESGKRDALLYAARSAEQASDWRLALANYRKAQKIDPDNFVIMNNAAAALNNLGMFEDGAKEAKRALQKRPDYVPAMINAAIAYSSKGESQEALRLFSEAAIADPGNRSLIINLGILQERTGKLDDAQVTYRPLADDSDPLALQGMARVYERKGNKGEAVRTYRQIMALPSANPALKREVKAKLLHLEE